MKSKYLLLALLVPLFSLAQQTKSQPKPPKEISPEIKELLATRDTAKSTLKQKTLENSKDVNHYKKIENNLNTAKEQYKSAKSAKKTEKMDAIQEKITADMDSLKELNAKIKSDEKELAAMEKDLDKAEKALQKQKDIEGKEKTKGKK